MSEATKIIKQVAALGNKTDAEQAQRFFKTGPGQYGEGDLFLGIRVPVLRQLAKEHRTITLNEAIELLQSPLHEVRLLALLVMVLQAKQNGEAVYRAYLDNTHRINNWDLVDCSAEHIVGAHLFAQKHRLPEIPGKPVLQETVTPFALTKLAKSNSLWERRIAIISTFYFIRRNQFDDTLAIADLLLHDKEDLMHKAVGWMLREVGKRDLATEENFLIPRYSQMPRTLLRYAIERFPESKRLAYLHGRIQ